jgi:hypothetical protein
MIHHSLDTSFQIKLEEEDFLITYWMEISRRSCSARIALEELDTALKVDFSLPYSLNATNSRELKAKEMKKNIANRGSGLLTSVSLSYSTGRLET